MVARVKLNSRGIEDVAKSAAMKAHVTSVAERVAENVRSSGIYVEGEPGDVALPVEVSSYETDRARSSVVIAHPSGKAVQAKHGVLTRAAARVGLEVTSR